MFIQVMRGKTNDAEGLQRQHERWMADLRPGATGFLGVTGGIADDGTVILLARFEDEESARANSDRPEQGEWWRETEACFDGEVMFRDCRDVDLTLAGGSDDAGFVQVMQGRVREKDRLRSMEEEFMPRMKEVRPDVIGSVRAWDGDFFTEAIYFTTEVEAREGEAAMASLPSTDAESFAEYMQLVEDVEFIDLRDPWLES